jgi:hypothetical protein
VLVGRRYKCQEDTDVESIGLGSEDVRLLGYRANEMKDMEGKKVLISVLISVQGGSEKIRSWHQRKGSNELKILQETSVDDGRFYARATTASSVSLPRVSKFPTAKT